MSATETNIVDHPLGTCYSAIDALMTIGNDLTLLEIREFLTICPDIYYFKTRDEPGEGSNSGWHGSDGHYLAIQDEHLMFRYRVMAIIDKGGHWQVLRCFDHKAGEEVAVKMLTHESMQHADLYLTELEVNMALRLSGGSPNIVGFLNCFNFRGHTCFVFQFIRDGDLYDYIPRTGLPVENIQKTTRSILQGLLFLKNHGIVHMDIKPTNILVTDQAVGEVCLADFGLSFFEQHGCEYPLT